MHVNTTSEFVPDPGSYGDGGSDGRRPTFTGLADEPFWECRDCGGIEEVPFGEEPPDTFLCGSCAALFDLEVSTLLSRTTRMFR